MRYKVRIILSFNDQLTTAQCVVLRSEINMLRAKLQDSESQKENYRNALIAAENHLERSHSRSVRDIESRAKVKLPEVSEEKEEVERKPSSPVVSGSVTWWEI